MKNTVPAWFPCCLTNNVQYLAADDIRLIPRWLHTFLVCSVYAEWLIAACSGATNSANSN